MKSWGCVVDATHIFRVTRLVWKWCCRWWWSWDISTEKFGNFTCIYWIHLGRIYKCRNFLLSSLFCLLRLEFEGVLVSKLCFLHHDLLFSLNSFVLFFEVPFLLQKIAFFLYGIFTPHFSRFSIFNFFLRLVELHLDLLSLNLLGHSLSFTLPLQLRFSHLLQMFDQVLLFEEHFVAIPLFLFHFG